MKVHISCKNLDHKDIIKHALSIQSIDVVDDESDAENSIKVDTPVRLGSLINRIEKSARDLQKNKPLQLGEFIFKPTINQLTNTKNNINYQLTEKETAIIQCLYNHHPNAVERSSLLENVWEYAPDTETHTVETHIYRLRQKIEQDSDENGLIITTEEGYSLNIT